MLGSSMIVIGMILAFSTSLKAIHEAKDRGFAVAALAVASCEAVGMFVAAIWTSL